MAESKSLLDALLVVQRDTPTLPKDKTNPHFKSRYTPLDTIVETVRPILAAQQLVWTTLPCRDERGDPALRYRLMHAPTGEVLEDTMPLLLSKQDAQGLGSALTYARRYALCAVLNLVADDDDDGNAAATPSRAGNRPANGKPPEPELPRPKPQEINTALEVVREAAPKLPKGKLGMLLRAHGAQTVEPGSGVRAALQSMTPEGLVAFVQDIAATVAASEVAA